MAETAVPARSFPNFEKLLQGHKALVHWHPLQAEYKSFFGCFHEHSVSFFP